MYSPIVLDLYNNILEDYEFFHQFKGFTSPSKALRQSNNL